MKITKIVFTFISFLLISQVSFALDVCPGTSAPLSYSSSNVPSTVTECNTLEVPTGFVPPTTKAIPNATGSWPIAVPPTATAGAKTFSLTCGVTVATTSSLNVLSADSQRCCGVSDPAKVWNGTTCGAPVGTIAVPATATIHPEESSATVPVTWTSAFALFPKIFRSGVVANISTAANDTLAQIVSFGATTFTLKNSTTSAGTLSTLAGA